jgi:hypothetical protein
LTDEKFETEPSNEHPIGSALHDRLILRAQQEFPDFFSEERVTKIKEHGI